MTVGARTPRELGHQNGTYFKPVLENGSPLFYGHLCARTRDTHTQSRGPVGRVEKRPGYLKFAIIIDRTTCIRIILHTQYRRTLNCEPIEQVRNDCYIGKIRRIFFHFSLFESLLVFILKKTKHLFKIFIVI